MTRVPSDPETKIGKPQVIARLVNLDGMQVLVRLQKPFEEAIEDENKKPNPKDESYIKYGTALIAEVWSDATRSVITDGIKKPYDQSEEAFQFGVRYMLNHSSDEEIAHILKLKGIHTRLRYQCGLDETSARLPKPPKRLEKKKPT
jgi:hypothetical protein